MDRRVKERLVGASILVVLIVLIVPALLSGPPSGTALGPATPRLPVSSPEPIRNVTVDLTTSRAPTPEPVAEAGAAARQQPQQAGNGEAASAVAGPGVASSATAISANPANATTNTTVAPSEAAASVPLETTPPPPTSKLTAAKPAIAGRAWNVQLGSFASHDNADKLLRQLKTQGFAAFISSGGSGASLRYRVRIGPMADRGAATQAVAKLKVLGHAASIVAPVP